MVEESSRWKAWSLVRGRGWHQLYNAAELRSEKGKDQKRSVHTGHPWVRGRLWIRLGRSEIGNRRKAENLPTGGLYNGLQQLPLRQSLSFAASRLFPRCPRRILWAVDPGTGSSCVRQHAYGREKIRWDGAGIVPHHHKPGGLLWLSSAAVQPTQGKRKRTHGTIRGGGLAKGIQSAWYLWFDQQANEHLQAELNKLNQRTRNNKTPSILILEEQAAMTAPMGDFDASELINPKVDKYSTVTVKKWGKQHSHFWQPRITGGTHPDVGRPWMADGSLSLSDYFRV